MKEIQNLTLWINGESKIANLFYLILINDNLKDTAVFQYQLFNQYTDANGYNQQELLITNNVIIDGIDYENWGNNTNINENAFTICANKLNITLK